ncbi:hypothetical protein [Fodinicola acaciae]|uniref:hypothetical protein n=1 Tax=Fodinicola acaciae TaxID=2681555 RepID=UPI0013D814B4|nr:hypothetical protein [Fodinicola acaciae]
MSSSAWLRDNGDHDAVLEALNELTTVTTTQDEFNYWWDEIYDHADMDRIWIET